MEPVLFAALILVYMWLVWPMNRPAWSVPYMALLLLTPVASNVAHRDSRRELGFRLDNLWRSAKEVAPVTLAAALVLIGLGLAVGNDVHLDPRVRAAAPTYPLWALLQQYALQGFVFRRLRESSGRPLPAALATGLLFGVVHLPNPVLMAAGFVGGVLWSLLFHRNPNLFTLSVSHGLVGLLIRVALPGAWHHGLAVGPRY